MPSLLVGKTCCGPNKGKRMLEPVGASGGMLRASVC
jgi:hypothetical protein